MWGCSNGSEVKSSCCSSRRLDIAALKASDSKLSVTTALGTPHLLTAYSFLEHLHRCGLFLSFSLNMHSKNVVLNEDEKYC